MTDEQLATDLGNLYSKRLMLDFSCKIYPEMHALFDAVFHCSTCCSSNITPLMIYSLIQDLK